MASSADALLATLDALIERHGRDNPELHKALSDLRADLEAAIKQRRREDVALAGLRIASWVKFLIDHLP